MKNNSTLKYFIKYIGQHWETWPPSVVLDNCSIIDFQNLPSTSKSDPSLPVVHSNHLISAPTKYEYKNSSTNSPTLPPATTVKVEPTSNDIHEPRAKFRRPQTLDLNLPDIFESKRDSTPKKSPPQADLLSTPEMPNSGQFEVSNSRTNNVVTKVQDSLLFQAVSQPNLNNGRFVIKSENGQGRGVVSPRSDENMRMPPTIHLPETKQNDMQEKLLGERFSNFFY